MVYANGKNTHTINLNERVIEQVESLKYLGVIIKKNRKLDKELIDKMGKTGRLFNRLRSTSLSKKENPKEVKLLERL